MNLFANARSRSLPPLFQWENESAQWTFLEDGTLSVTAPGQTDLFCDPAGRHVDNVPFLYRELTGDFQVWTRVEVDLEAEFDAACLVVRGPEGQWAKLALEYPNRIPTIVSVVTRQTSDDANHERLQEPSALLRISRMGQTFAFHYTLPGQPWFFVRYFALDVPETVRVGVAVQSPRGQGCRARFQFLEYEPRTLRDRRSGE